MGRHGRPARQRASRRRDGCANRRRDECSTLKSGASGPKPEARGLRPEPMAVLIQSILSGILIGGVYALIGIGMTLIFGVMRVMNFAQGELVMVGMYVACFLFKGLGMDPFASVVITLPALFLLGALLQRTLINQVLDALPQNQILLTIGIGLVLSNLAMLFFTSDYRIRSTTYSSSSVPLAGLRLSPPLLNCFLTTPVIPQR